MSINFNWLDYPLYCKDVIIGSFRYYIQPYLPKIYNPTKITDNVFISDLQTAFFRDKMIDDGITHIITTIMGVYPIYPNDFEYLHIQLRDALNENIIEHLDKAYRFIEDATSGGGKVLIHCAYGISRSGSILIYYIMRKYGKSYDEALEMVRNKRQIIKPNIGYERQLRAEILN